MKLKYIIIALSAIIALSFFFALYVHPVETKPASIIIFGDSISSDIPGGYPNFIREMKPTWKVKVHAYPGSNSDFVSLQSDKIKNWQDYTHVLVLCGINDWWENNPQRTAKNIQHIFSNAVTHKSINIKCRLLTYPNGKFLTPTDICHPMCITISKKLQFLDKAYLMALSKGDEVYSLSASVEQEAFQPDGLHLRVEGNRQLAERLVDHIERENK
jgi:hypothetical protein